MLIDLDAIERIFPQLQYEGPIMLPHAEQFTWLQRVN